MFKNCKGSIPNISILNSRLNFEEKKVELMNNMLWLSIRQRGKNLEYPSLGVRKGFKIVSSPVEDEKDKQGITGTVIVASAGTPDILKVLSEIIQNKGEGPISGIKKRFEF